MATTGLRLLIWATAIVGGMAASPTAPCATAAEGAAAQESPRMATKDVVLPIVKIQAAPFDLCDVRLLDGPFKHAMELDRRYLLSLDPDRLLLVFRLNAGILSDAKPYGGWMAPTANSRGEFVGHYLSACARMVADTGDETLKRNADRVVAGLLQCQEKLGGGFLHAHPDSFSTRGEAPLPFWYQFHKVLAGLLDMHEYGGNPQALGIAKRMGDWACAGSSRLTDAQMQAMLAVEHGGINEAFANLYARTGDERYLKLSLRFNHAAVIAPASEGKDNLDGLHANTQIPKFIGAARQHELTGDESLRKAAVFFWENVVRERSYVIGGNSDGEKFTEKASLSKALSPGTCETCNTYNMLKLTGHLFQWAAKAEYADYWERALYNHILAAQHPKSGMMCYYVCLNGPQKTFGEAEDSFWCCYGTGIESHARYGEGIYFRGSGESLYVNLFIASELHWKQRGLTLRQETRFPESDTSRLTVTCRKPIQLTLNIRRPYWATSGMEISVNGEKQAMESPPSSFVPVSRQWSSGDTVDVRLPMSIRTEGFRDNPNRLAILYGPLVLSSRTESSKSFQAIIAGIDQILSSVHATDKALCFEGSSTVFRALGPGREKPVRLIPFYRECDSPHVVYWDVLTESQWKTQEEGRRAKAEREARMKSQVEVRFQPHLNAVGGA